MNKVFDWTDQGVSDLVALADEIRTQFAQETDESKKGTLAREAVEVLLEVVAALAGDEIMQSAFPKPKASEPRHQHLAALKERLGAAGSLFTFHDKLSDQHSLRAAYAEIDYMLRGYAPRLFAPVLKVGKFSNTIKLAEHWLRAWEWVEYLALRSGTKGECKQAVAEAYGIERDRLEKWKGQARDYLHDEVDRRLQRVRDRRSPRFRFRTEPEGREALEDDARAFRAEERYDGAASENAVSNLPRDREA